MTDFTMNDDPLSDDFDTRSLIEPPKWQPPLLMRILLTALIFAVPVLAIVPVYLALR